MSLHHLSCRECKRRCDNFTFFSVEQWIAMNGSPICIECDKNTNKGKVGRENKSENAEFDDDDLEKPFAEGGFRYAVLGTYKGGRRDGEPCVCKWFKKEGLVFEDIYYDLDIKAMHKACDIIMDWNKRRYIDKPVRINIPEVWTFDETCSEKWKWSKVLVEPYIKNYTKYNSSSGWTSKSASSWHRAMQGLSHFSYHISNGEYVLCDLQGGVYSNAVILTDPVILSRKKEFGVSDLGPKGISSFFSCHKCNEFCKSHWILPTNLTRYYKPKQGTSLSSAGTGAQLHVSAGSNKSKRQRTTGLVGFRDTIAQPDLNMLPPTTAVGSVRNSSNTFSFVMPPPSRKQPKFERILPQAPPPRPRQHQQVLPPPPQPRPSYQQLLPQAQEKRLQQIFPPPPPMRKRSELLSENEGDNMPEVNSKLKGIYHLVEAMADPPFDERIGYQAVLKAITEADLDVWNESEVLEKALAYYNQEMTCYASRVAKRDVPREW